jgi:transposase-like protein
MTKLPFPENALEFQEKFSTEENCWKYLYSCRWPDGFKCPRCGGNRASIITTRGLIQCLDCRYQASVTSGTVMHRSRTPLRKWFWAAFLASTHTPGFSALQFQRYAGLKSYKTGFNMLHKLRASMVRPERDRIRGYVEVDETYIGGPHEGKRGRGAEGKVIVAGAIEVLDEGAKKTEKRVGRLRLRIVPDVSAASLIGFIEDTAEEGSVIITDDFGSYEPLHGSGYAHHVVESKAMEHIHRTFGNLKTWLEGTHHGVSEKHLQAYLNEFTFRHNRRRMPMAAFQTVLGLATHTHGPTYKELYATGERYGWTHPNPKV